MKPREPGVYTHKGQIAVVRRDPIEGLLYFTMSGSGCVRPTDEWDWEEVEEDKEVEEGQDKEQDKDTDPTLAEIGRPISPGCFPAYDALEKGRMDVLHWLRMRGQIKATRETESDGIVNRVADIRGGDEFHEGFQDGVCVLNPSNFDNIIKIETRYLPEYLQSLAEHEPDFLDGKMYFVLVTREKKFADQWMSRIRTMISITKYESGIDFQNDLVIVSATESKDLIGLNVVGAFVTPDVAKEVVETVQLRVRTRMARFQ